VLSSSILNLPNLLTLLRIGAIPLFLILLTDERYTEALLVFVVAGVTDSLDGAIARLTNSHTALGAYIDPLADKLLLLSSRLCASLASDLGDQPGYHHSAGVRGPVFYYGSFDYCPTDACRQSEHVLSIIHRDPDPDCVTQPGLAISPPVACLVDPGRWHGHTLWISVPVTGAPVAESTRRGRAVVCQC
jgi:hypothetical protein